MAQEYNLIIFYVPKIQHVADFITLRNMMYGAAPDITVHIIGRDNTTVPQDFWAKVAARPTLIFSPAPIKIPPLIRGTRIIPNVMSKSEEAAALAAAGAPVPASVPVTPDFRLDERTWGPFTVTKPDVGGQGAGIRLTRTRDVRWVDPRSWPADDPRHGRGILAQKFINTGPYARSHRVFTVLGHAIYSIVSIASEKFTLPDPDGKDAVDIRVAANGGPRVIEMSHDPEIIALAEGIHRKFPYVPNMGVDIIRNCDTGELFVLEINSRSYSWHLSSDYGLDHQRTFGLDYYGQFNALGTIARALIETTRRMAS